MSSFRILLASLFATCALALPVEAPAPTARAHIPRRQLEILRPGDAQIQPCTHTISATYSRLPTPPYWPWCEESGDATHYAATETKYRKANCGGCLFATVQNFPKDAACPDQGDVTTATATVTVDETTTVYETLCSPTTALEDLYPRQVGDVPEEDAAAGDVLVGGGDEAAPQVQACSTTLVVPEAAVGVTVTVYVDLIAVTSKVPCGGCVLEVSTRVGGMGPMIQPGVTATLDVGMTTVYECED